MRKRCLVISYGPVPTPENQIIEGGGMRVWGLAKGLAAHDIDVTIAVNAGFPLVRTDYEGISLINWSFDAEFARILNTFNAVIVSYNMGDLSMFVTDHIRDDVQLILDAYVPIYIEVSARNAHDMDTEYQNYMADLARHNHALQRGDYFLYANHPQKQFYDGVLSALGIINPFSYHTQRLLEVPFGVHNTQPSQRSNPYTALGINQDDFVVLWFGGLYPWFRVDEYLHAIHQLSQNVRFKFVFVGGKNPFNQNPDLARQYTHAINYAKAHGLTNKSVYFVDWIEFDTRINWFAYADVIISLNQPGDENGYSWRTRVIDFVWGEAATITNGGDPLSDMLVQHKAAISLPNLSEKSILETLLDLQKNPAKLADVRKRVAAFKRKYFWDTLMQPVAEVIELAQLPYLEERALRDAVISDTTTPQTRRAVRVSTLLRKVQKKGVMQTAKIATTSFLATSKRFSLRGKGRQFVFISHPLDNTGAPVVLLDVIEEYVTRYGASRVRVITPGVNATQMNRLKSLGITPEHAVYGASFRMIRLQLSLHVDDFVFMNTIAIYDNYRDFILTWLRIGRLRSAYWFIHEDPLQIPAINQEFSNSRNIDRIRSLEKTHKLTLFTPSKRTSELYLSTFDFHTSPVKLRVDVPAIYRQKSAPESFETIRIILAGTSSDGRKGQLLALSALQDFLHTFYVPHPQMYRQVQLVLVAVSKDDYISQQVRWIAASLGESVKVYDSLPREEFLDVATHCNVTLCCSLNETFGLYVAEGMSMGHVILRNDTAGREEQLSDQKNGFLIDHTQISSISRAIETLANKKTSARKLRIMSNHSKKMAAPYLSVSYIQQITQNQSLESR